MNVCAVLVPCRAFHPNENSSQNRVASVRISPRFSSMDPASPLREHSMRLPHTQPQSGMVKPVIGAVIARRWLRLGNGRRLIASIHRPHRTGRDWTSAVVMGRKTKFIYGVRCHSKPLVGGGLLGENA